MARHVLVLGATSAIAQETAKLLARDGDRIFLVARNPDKLAIVAADLRVRGAGHVGELVADLDDVSRHTEIVERAAADLQGLDTLIVAYGVLGDDTAWRDSFADAERIFRTNLMTPISWITQVARRFEGQGHGTIVAIGSVAGDRGRQSNYVYGSAKGGLGLFLQGLRNRLHEKGVSVITVKPGFVDTPMTGHVKKNPLFAGPRRIARGIHGAIRRRKDVVYLPGFWRLIMSAIRAVPETVFKRLKL